MFTFLPCWHKHQKGKRVLTARLAFLKVVEDFVWGNAIWGCKGL